MSEPILVEHRVGGWLPKNQNVLDAWLAKKIEIAFNLNREWLPVVQEFQQLIENNAEIYMGFHRILGQAPAKPPYNGDPTKRPQGTVLDYIGILALFDLIITEAPAFEDGNSIAFPINAILDWAMGTPGSLATFLHPEVNAQFSKMFRVWADFLKSSDSRSVLTTEENGWFGTAALAAMPNFAETYVCDPEAEYYGFQSWDDFFTRVFREGVRPVESATEDNVITSPCESTLYNTASLISARDSFWLKGETYSLNHILNNDPYAPQFVDGTIYQAYLSALSYHRWHAPVNGKVVKVVNVPGAYFAESPVTGLKDPERDDDVPSNSQVFFTAVAARALIFIEADNAAIGLMCFVAVGMADVSTCQVTVAEGQAVLKGDQIGTFHYGGSTHCLIFRQETKITFSEKYAIGDAVPLNAAIATVEA